MTTLLLTHLRKGTMMCIVCNCDFTGQNGYEHPGSDFLNTFARANQAMGFAAKDMLRCSQNAHSETDRKRYDAVHKKMVRMRKEWNALEHEREVQGECSGARNAEETK